MLSFIINNSVKTDQSMFLPEKNKQAAANNADSDPFNKQRADHQFSVSRSIPYRTGPSVRRTRYIRGSGTYHSPRCVKQGECKDCYGNPNDSLLFFVHSVGGVVWSNTQSSATREEKP
jgi:hypothetical protein